MNIYIASPTTLMQQSLEVACAFPQYMKTLDIPEDVATNRDYQKNFNAYYRIRRNQEWLHTYYAFMQKNKSNMDLTFRDVLTYFADIPHRVKVSDANPSGMTKSIEASFSSKLLATINPNYPIWDSQVVRAVGISIPYPPSIDFYVKAYDELNRTIHEFINTPNGKACIAEFDARFPNHRHFSSVKKIDFFLWNIGK